MIQININDLFNKTFNYTPPFPTLLVRRFDQRIAKSKESEGLRNRGEAQDSQIADVSIVYKNQRLELDPPPVVAVSTSKNIITTEVPGNDFSIKEIVSGSDYKITMQGFLFGENVELFDNDGFSVRVRTDEFPEQKLQQLINIYRINDSVELECDYLRMMSIDLVVIESIDFPSFDGMAGVFPYNISMISDKYVELELDNKNG